MIYTVTFNPSLDYIVEVEDFKYADELEEEESTILQIMRKYNLLELAK